MCYNGRTKGMRCGDAEQSLNHALSSDRSLQLGSVKLDWEVIVDQHATVNRFLDLVLTARHCLGGGCCSGRRQPVRRLPLTGSKS